ncbi:MAG: AAA family ATPase [Planctomycetota bacterium]
MIPQSPANGMPPVPPPPGPSGPGKFKPVDPMRFARKYVWVLVAAAVVGGGVGIGLQVVLANTMPAYSSRAQMIVVPSDRAFVSSSPEGSRDEFVSAFIANEIARIQSERVLRNVIERQAVLDTQWITNFDTPDDAIKALREDVLTISPFRSSELINLTAETPRSREDCVTILTTLINVYTDILQLESDSRNADQRTVYQQDVNRQEERIRLLQDQSAAFARNEEIDSLDTRSSQAMIVYRELVQRMTALNFALGQARVGAEAIQEKVDAGDFQPTLEDQMAADAHPLVMGHSQRIQSLKEQLGMLNEMGRPNSHTAHRISAQIAAAEDEKQLEVNRQIQIQMQQRLEGAQNAVTSLEGNIADLADDLEEAEARSVDLTTKLARYRELQKELDLARDRRDRAQRTLDELAMTSALPNAVRVQRYVAPERPSRSFPPGIPTMAAMGMFGTLGLIGGLLFLREVLDPRFTSPADVGLLPEAELLAVLPHASEDPSGQTDIACVVQRQPNGLIAESFRQLRTDLLARVDRRGYRAVLVAGTAAGSGTTTVVQNLALSVASNARRVLIVDANLRRPRLPDALGLPETPGLADYLAGTAGGDEIVHALSDLPLSVLPCGSDPQRLTAESFESRRCRELLTRLESEFDLVLIDCPPVLLTSEAKILAKHVDAAVVVTRANRDKRGMTARAIRRVSGQRADMLGVVLNGVRGTAGGYFRQNFRDFYRYGQTSDRRDALRRPQPQPTEAVESV